MWHSKEWTAGNKDIILESVENGLLTIKWIVIENNVSCDKKNYTIILQLVVGHTTCLVKEIQKILTVQESCPPPPQCSPSYVFVFSDL
jgi:hypothetical protein